MATMFGKGDGRHTHQCINCQAEIPCDSPDDPQGCFVSTLTCGSCDDTVVDIFDVDVDIFDEPVEDCGDEVFSQVAPEYIA